MSDVLVIVSTIIPTLLTALLVLMISRSYDPFEDIVELVILGGGICTVPLLIIPEKLFGKTIFEVSANIQQLAISVGFVTCILIIIFGSIVTRIRRNRIEKRQDKNEDDSEETINKGAEKVSDESTGEESGNENDIWEEKRKEIKQRDPDYYH